VLESFTMISSFVLASNSPRRRQLFQLFDLPFKVIPADVDENLLPNEAPDVYVQRLAKLKAQTSGKFAANDELVIASDTTVAEGGRILGKPSDDAEARQMLRQLRGRHHQVFTALAVYSASDQHLETDLCISTVPMRAYDDQEIEAYIASGDPFDKAGGYAIQNEAFHPVIHFRGCYASVMGFPMCHLTRMLRKWDHQVAVDIPQACQTALQYDCPISSRVLDGEQVG